VVAGEESKDAIEAADFVDQEGEHAEFCTSAQRDEVEEGLWARYTKDPWEWHDEGSSNSLLMSVSQDNWICDM